MQCTKTGAHVHLASHDDWLYGDVFKTTNGDFIMRVCERRHKPLLHVKHFTFLSYDVWWNETETSGDRNSTLAAEGVIEHGYDGVPV